MRAPQDLPAPAPRLVGRRGRWWIVAAVVVVVLLASLKSLATVYTDSLWFSSVGLHSVWSTLLADKVGLFASFGAFFFVALWANLVVCDHLGAQTVSLEPEDELVRRYQRAVRPYAGRLHVALAVVCALIAASSAVGQWDNWILFTHGVPFGRVDPQFHWDIGFYVFRLPFLNFVVEWLLFSLVVVFVITLIFHYFNGGIRLQRAVPRVRPAVKVHLSVLLALVALVKAAGYFLARYQLTVSGQGYVGGAGYTDVKSRLPALELLFYVSLLAAVVLLVNVRRQGWTLPVLAVGTWAFVALVIGVIYPAVLQTFRVNPAQSTLELPYIARNISATRAAYGLDHVQVARYSATTNVSSAKVESDPTAQATIGNIRLWDPAPQIAQQTFQKVQAIKSYYTFPSLAVDRYRLGGQTVPVLIGVRQINSSNLPATSWVNTHLQYTHGIGAALAPANTSAANAEPAFALQNVPPQPTYPSLQLNQPDVYFGLDQPGYVVADTKQMELDYEVAGGSPVENHYGGGGGVRMGSLLTRAAFAVRLGDLNLLISNLITGNSRMIFVRDVQQMAAKAAPFLSFDSSPYAAIVNGHIDWVLDAYTTTSQYPYSQNADTVNVPAGSGLPGSYNYVRNSVKVVVNAYTGKMTFYAMDNDPILRTYESAFPRMFTPGSKMPAAIRAHLRYPQDMFSVQAALYGRYHITSPSAFFSAGDAWTLSPTAGAGSPSQALAVTQYINPQGQTITGPLTPMSPIYQEMALPGQHRQSFTITDDYVPYSSGNQSGNQNLSAFMIGTSHPGQYEALHVYVTPSNNNVVGPVLADSNIQSDQPVSQLNTLLDQHGSQVLLGNILTVPIENSILYIRPYYVTSSSNPLPQLRYVIAVFGAHVEVSSTLYGAVNAALGTNLGSGTRTGTGSSGGTGPVTSVDVTDAATDLKQAATYYQQAEAALRAGGANALGTYQSDVANAQQLNNEALQLLGGGSSGAASRPTKSAAGASGSRSGTGKSGTSSSAVAAGGTSAGGSAANPSTETTTASATTNGSSTGSSASTSTGNATSTPTSLPGSLRNGGSASTGSSTTTTVPASAA
ncbi:MAG: UPF0182 family protein [Acidimicrobiales bacterium]